jgi:hypothetical protein
MMLYELTEVLVKTKKNSPVEDNIKLEVHKYE